MIHTEIHRDPNGTRAALLEAATELFAARGFEGTPTQLIATGARVNKALINYHFGGKAGLYRAILETTFLDLNRRLEEVDSPGAAPEDRLGRFIEVFAETNRLRPAVSAMLLREILSGGTHLDDRILPAFLAIFSRVRGLVRDGVREGSFRQVDPLLTHLTVIGALVFFFATTPFRERLVAEGKLPIPSPDPAAFVRHLQELMSRGLAADEKERS